MRAQSLVEGVAELHQNKAGKAIVLKNADPEMIRSALIDNPFLMYGMGRTYFVPEDVSAFRADRLYKVVKTWYVEPGKLLQMIDEKQAVVYDVRGEHVADVTASYRQAASGSQTK